MPKPPKPTIVTTANIWDLLEYILEVQVDNQSKLELKLEQIEEQKIKVELPRRQN